MNTRRKLTTAATALCLGGMLAAVWAGCDNPARKKARGDEPWPTHDLSKHLAAGGPPPESVAVALPHRPEPTADPLVWVFRRAYNAPALPPDYELRFSTPPDFSGKPPYRVAGRPAFIPDGRRRSSGLHGYTIISSPR